MEKKSSFIKNIVYAFTAQGIALALSVFMSLIVPKILGVDQYSYWQLFIFYSGYVGFFHFGLNDGIYLRLGGQSYEELNYSILGGEMRVLFYAELMISAIISVVVIFSSLASARKYVIFFTAFYLVISNLSLFLGYIFQAVNLTKIYSLSVIWDRVLVLICFAILVCLRITDFHFYVLCYSLSKLSSLLYCAVKGKKIVFSAKASFQGTLRWVKEDIFTGINIMIANIAGSLILGVGRMVIDQCWGIESFGKFSFSLSLTNFFLLFISQISMVLFPALRQVNQEKMKIVYVKMRFLVSILLPCAFVIYVPMRIFLLNWLPAYEESLYYMILLLPICTFDGKMQLLCNTYLKVLRKERKLLYNNLMALGISVVMCLISGYILKNVTAVAISMVLALAVRSIVSELYLSDMMNEKLGLQLCLECLLAVIFVVVNWYMDSLAAFILVLISYVLFAGLSYFRYKNAAKM